MAGLMKKTDEDTSDDEGPVQHAELESVTLPAAAAATVAATGTAEGMLVDASGSNGDSSSSSHNVSNVSGGDGTDQPAPVNTSRSQQGVVPTTVV